MEGIWEWAEVFFLDRKSRGLSPKTLEFYWHGVKAMVKILGDKPVGEISAMDLRRFLAESLAEGLSPGGVMARWRAVRAFLRWVAQEGGLPDPGVLSRVKPPKVPEADLPVVRASEIRRLLAAAHTSLTPLRDTAIILLLWDTGLRAGELLGIRLGDVLSHGVRVRRKGGHEQVLPVSLPTKRALRAYVQSERPESDWDVLFLTKGGEPLTYNGLRSALMRLAEKAGVPYKPPHAFRRGAAVAMVKNGLNPYALQLLMGHKDQSITARYVRLAEKDLAEAHHAASPVLSLGTLRRRAGPSS